MTKTLYPLLSILLFSILLFTGCQDKCQESQTSYELQSTFVSAAEYDKFTPTLSEPREISNAGLIIFEAPYLYVNEYNKGIHIIDNSNPSNPSPAGFLPIQNNKHFQVSDGIIFANRYHDIVAIDLRNHGQVKELQRIKNAYPDESYISDDGIFSSFDVEEKYQFVDCDQTTYGSAISPTDALEAASNLARTYTLEKADLTTQPTTSTLNSDTKTKVKFIVSQQHLYLLGSNQLSILDISDPNNISTNSVLDVETGAQSLFTLHNFLIVAGVDNSSMYNISNASSPSLVSKTSPIGSCTPIVANQQNAYVAIRKDNECGFSKNRMNILNIQDMANPIQTHSSSMPKNPQSLALAGSHLYVCEGKRGILILDVKDETKAACLKHYSCPSANNILAITENVLVVSGTDGIFQLDISDRSNPQIISQL